MDIAAQGTTSINIAIRDLTWVAFFSLVQLDEYYKGSTDTAHHPFRLMNVQFFIGQQPYNAALASNAVLSQVDFASLLFITQKNCVKGGSIGHGRTGHPQECPVAAMYL